MEASSSSSFESPRVETVPQVKRVTVEMVTVVPPNCVKRVPRDVDGDMNDTFMFQPTHTLPIWTPRIVFDRGKNVSVYVNLTNSHYQLPCQ